MKMVLVLTFMLQNGSDRKLFSKLRCISVGSDKHIKRISTITSTVIVINIFAVDENSDPRNKLLFPRCYDRTPVD